MSGPVRHAHARKNWDHDCDPGLALRASAQGSALTPLRDCVSPHCPTDPWGRSGITSGTTSRRPSRIPRPVTKTPGNVRMSGRSNRSLKSDEGHGIEKEPYPAHLTCGVSITAPHPHPIVSAWPQPYRDIELKQTVFFIGGNEAVAEQPQFVPFLPYREWSRRRSQEG